MLAAAHLLQTDIFVFDDTRKTWSRYSGKLANCRLGVETEGIYLKHCYRAHYEVVLSVEEQNKNISQPSTNTASKKIVYLTP